MEASTRELRLHTAKLLAAAERGEEVVITDRGKRRAVLRRWSEPEQEQQPRNPAYGLWKDRGPDMEDEVRRRRQGIEWP